MDLLRSLPLGLYLEQPQTWLHKLDPRVKIAWLMSFLTSYSFANNQWRILLVVLLILFTLMARIPQRVWKEQMGWLLTLTLFVFLLISISPDGLGVQYQPRLPTNLQVLIPAANSNTDIVPAATGATQDYSYILFHKGPVTVTRRSLDLATRVSTILFTVIYSSNLYLLTTAPEEITTAIASLMRPLRRFQVPVTEITLTLTLSLRFIPLVLEEVQNLSRSVMTRAINWKKLGLKGSVKLWLIIAERLLKNLLLRAEQMANAMMVRGFTSPNEHEVKWHELRLQAKDWLAIAILTVFWGARLVLGNLPI
ncbi:energy-coupling factor transporter transmembrane protein EcfT [Nodularia harveyana UHCC-0300]|uniref:Energy-coupling factor transporter transmembrane protein EcfT n=1 Tax=Nodularia harveyana UHCC-0300 TaxID=2974287 RepID=A0ABU5UDR6_9CYAN|nr:energy-coupling factor transporter transmembrane protein EcfT [Nodularia harveyana]MEA5581659.1 energy-coupling factor transporter transmembrane protein EcfT [Nodularia harveyana UHCC-0300]